MLLRTPVAPIRVPSLEVGSGFWLQLPDNTHTGDSSEDASNWEIWTEFWLLAPGSRLSQSWALCVFGQGSRDGSTLSNK